MKWIPYPMVRISAFFVAGILLAIYSPELLSFRFAVIVSAILFFTFFLSAFFLKKKTGAWLGFVAMFSLFLFGFCRLYLAKQSNAGDHLLKLNSEVQAYEAIVRSVPEEKIKSWKVELELTAVKTMSWQPITGRVLLYIAKDGIAPAWHYGDLLLVQGSPVEIKPPANPGEFDFKRFLGFKNIYHQQFARSAQLKSIGRAESKGFIYYSHQARAWSMQKLNQFIHGEQQQVIAAALVVGVTDGIDNDLQNAYAASGAMHVLAVSGLHVGIIYAIILFLLKPLHRYSWSRWFIAGISLLFLWSFAFVTGLSPSVLRAVTMFSFIAIARPLGWRTNIYNTLAGSAFVLLLYNPFLVMSVGFQLSYLAVLGIVYLQRPLYNLWEIDNRAGDWIWQITCVSIAAQVATFSLGLLYFHQFPVYFLVSNLFVIPLSTLVLVAGIFLLVISFISPVAQLTGFLLEWTIKALNWIVFQTEDLPFSLINNIYLNTFQCWLLMGVLFCLIMLFEWKKIEWLYSSFVLTLIFVFTQWNHFLNDVRHDDLVIYSINNHYGIEFTSNGQSYFVTDSLLVKDRERTRFHIQPNRLTHGVSTISSQITFAKDTLGVKYFLWKDKLIGWVSDRKYRLPRNIMLDYLLVSNNSVSGSSLRNALIHELIFDGSNSQGYIDRNFRRESIRFYSTLEHGAFVLNN
jgi:competence protein ComEC